MATIKDYRAALRRKYGAYNYRLCRDGGIEIKANHRWIFYGWIGDFETEYRLGFVQ